MSKIPSICLIPSGYKANKVYSVLPTNGDGDLTFSRSGEATRVNQLGLIETVATEVPRLDYSDGGCPSLLLEPESRNLITNSEDLDFFVKGGTSTLTSNQEISPDGTLTADLISDADDLSFGGNNIHTTISVSASSDYVFSVYVKSIDATVCGIAIRDDSSGTFTRKENISINPNEWTRVEVSRLSGSGTSSMRPYIGGADGDFLVWGAQLEQGSYATSYIPTSGATATRSAETASKTGLQNYINSSGGVLYLHIIAPNKFSNGAKTLVELGGVGNRVYVTKESSNQNIFQLGTQSSEGFNFINTSEITTENIKFAIRFKDADNGFFVNGVKVGSASSNANPTNISNILLGDIPSSENTDIKIKDLRIYNQALTDAELQTLTS